MTLMHMGAAQTPASGTAASPLRAYFPTEAAIARVLIAAACRSGVGLAGRRAVGASPVCDGRGGLTEERMIQAQAMAARAACARMTMPHLAELQDSVERACGLRGRSQWGRKAVAHAELFGLLAGVVDDPLLTPLMAEGAVYAREVMLVVGRAADGMIVSSRRRLLAHLRAGDGDAAALEMERHLRGLLYMGRLARATVSEAVA